jgi:MurNAc alpha-1-phosphate uridylyltransferase
LAESLPKPLLDVGGERLIERHLRRLADAGVREVIINLAYKAELLRRSIGETTRWGQRVAYSEEGEPALETGGGIVHALPLLGEGPFLVVNADVYTDFDFASLLDESRPSTLVLVPNPPHHPHGDFGLAASGLVTLDAPLLTFSGISLLRVELFAAVTPGRQPLRPILEAAIRSGTLHGVVHSGLWHDVGTPQRLAALRRLGAE